MKTIKSIFVIITTLFVQQAFAADLTVAENGTGGAYASITDAYNAASNGDRIIIFPQSGNAPYVENLTISKSLQFLSGTEGQQYTVQGNIVINPAIGREVTFIEMRLLTGSISTTANSPTGTRTKVSIINCSLLSGNIAFDYDNFDVQLVSNVITGSVTYRYGRMLGNTVDASALGTSTAVTVNTDAQATNDTLLIIGNKITTGTGYYYYYYGPGINFNSTSQFFGIMNNYISNPVGSYGYANAIYVSATKNSGTGTNFVINNTYYSPVSITYGMNFTSSNPNALVVVKNNLFVAPTVSTTITNSGTQNLAASFNYSTGGAMSGIVDDGTNNFASNSTLDANGRLLAGSDGINGGDADSSYYDINLTRNDVGCYGGSFTLDNFFPVTGAARVYFMIAPRRVTIGNTIGIKADSYDK